MIIAEPDFTVPIPMDLEHEEPRDLRERADRAFNTTQFLIENGLEDIHISQEDAARAREDFLDAPQATNVIDTTGKALMLKALLSEYDSEVIRSAVQLRNYVKLRLLELSSCGKESIELKAVELLGKLAEVAAFSENVNVTVEHKTTREIESELADKLVAYLGEDIADAEVVDPIQIPVHDKLPDAEDALGDEKEYTWGE